MGPIRRTQRAPKSCTNCSRRRVKCDKNIPCISCVTRGEEEFCSRETVLVNGFIKNGEATRASSALPHLSSVAQLVERIEHLESQLASTQLKQQQQQYRPHGQDRNSEKKQDQPSIEVQAYLNSNKFTIYNSEWDSTGIDSVPEDSSRFPEFKDHQQSSDIVRFSLNSLSFIHCAIHTPNFYIDYQRPDIATGSLSRGEWLECAIWYGLLCCGVYFADDEQLNRWGFVEHSSNKYSEKFLKASLESLHRAEYMKFPDIRTVQAFCVLSLCFNQLNSRHLQDCLHLTAIYMSQTLGLSELPADKYLEKELMNQQSNPHSHDFESFKARSVDREICRRIWWTVVIIDWLRVGTSKPTIDPNSFTTALPLNCDIANYQKDMGPGSTESQELTPVTYHIAMAKVSQIRIRRKNTVAEFQDCDSQLRVILDSLPEELKFATNPHFSVQTSYGNGDSVPAFQRFLITMVIAHERLLVNLHISSHVSTYEWNSTYKPVCLTCAQTIIDICCMDIPSMFKKSWLVPGDGVPAAVLLLLHYMENPQDSTNQSTKIFDTFMPLLEQLSNVNELAARGLNLLREMRQRDNSDIDIYNLMKRRKQYPHFRSDTILDSELILNQVSDFDNEFWDQIMQNFV